MLLLTTTHGKIPIQYDVLGTKMGPPYIDGSLNKSKGNDPYSASCFIVNNAL